MTTQENPDGLLDPWSCIFCGELLSALARQFGPMDEPWCEACDSDSDRNVHPGRYADRSPGCHFLCRGVRHDIGCHRSRQALSENTASPEVPE